MNEKIASILKTKIENLDFIDKIAGLVRPLRTQIQGSNNSKVIIIKPIATDVKSNDKVSSEYQELVPESKYKSVIFFEDAGCAVAYKERNWIGFNSRLTLLVWLNIKQLMECGAYTGSTEIILSILANFPEQPFSNDIYREITIKAISEVPKTNAIFGKYSFNNYEFQSQYLIYPFDYFALNISIDFKVNLSCVEEFKRKSCSDCC